mmetsp:Transcript_79089/g.173414  ORF Transcript_79089/g.173414 Transcript_79089/m.173414 type:complete len:280 (+) Transcript_79089:616-1455(+)
MRARHGGLYCRDGRSECGFGRDEGPSGRHALDHHQPPASGGHHDRRDLHYALGHWRYSRGLEEPRLLDGGRLQHFAADAGEGGEPHGGHHQLEERDEHEAGHEGGQRGLEGGQRRPGCCHQDREGHGLLPSLGCGCQAPQGGRDPRHHPPRHHGRGDELGGVQGQDHQRHGPGGERPERPHRLHEQGFGRDPGEPPHHPELLERLLQRGGRGAQRPGAQRGGHRGSAEERHSPEAAGVLREDQRRGAAGGASQCRGFAALGCPGPSHERRAGRLGRAQA